MDERLTPRNLGPRGSALWESLTSEGTRTAQQLILAAEACRLTDRLDQLDLILRGDIDTWAVLVHDARTEDYTLRIDAAEGAARQTANTLRLLLAELESTSTVKAGGSREDQLAAARAARKARATS